MGLFTGWRFYGFPVLGEELDRVNIYVGNLSYDATEDDMRNAFAAFGQVIRGMEVVRHIQTSPANGQTLTPPIRIVRMIVR